MASGLGSLLSAASPLARWGSVAEPPLLVRTLRWSTVVLWVVIFLSQFQAVVSRSSPNWLILILITALFAGVHLRFWYGESERDRRVRAIDRARGRVYEDELTGLPNSRYLLFGLRRQMIRSVRSGCGFSLVMVEVRPINPVFRIGDQIVKTLGRRVHQTIDPADFLARMQACTFAIITEDDGRLGSTEKGNVLSGIVEAGIPVDMASEVRMAVSVTSYGGEMFVRDFLCRVQEDFLEARPNTGSQPDQGRTAA